MILGPLLVWAKSSVALGRERRARTAWRGGLARVMVIAGALLVVAQMHRLGGGVIAAWLHERAGFSGAEVGLIIGAMFFGSAVAQLPMGLAFDRFGARRTVSAAALVGIVGIVVFGLSATLPGLVFGRLLIGLGFAGVVTAILLLTMRWAPPERFSQVAATVMGLASGAGSLLATLPLAGMLAAVGWPATFLALAAVSALIALLILIAVRDAPPGGETPRSAEGVAESLLGLLRLLRQPEVRRVLAMAVVAIAPFACVGGLWAGPYLRDIHGLSQTGMGAVLLTMVAVLNLGTLAYGPLDRVLNTRKGVVLGGAGISAAALLALAVPASLPFWAALVLLHLVALGTPFYVTLAAHCRSFVPDQQAGRAITLLNLLALTGTFTAQWLTGLIMSALADGTGLGSPLGYRAVFAFVALLLVLAGTLYSRAPDRPPRPGPGP